MTFSSVYYIQTNVLCIILFLILLYLNGKNGKANTAVMVFMNQLMYLTIAYCIADVAAWLLDGRVFAGARVLLFIFNIIYLSVPCIICYSWLSYVHMRLYRTQMVASASGKLLVFPLCLTMMIMLTTPITQFGFSINESNNYVRGIGAYLSPFLCWLYLIYAEIIVTRFVLDEKNILKKEEARPLLIFAIPILVASILQVIFFGTDLNQVGLFIGVFLVFMDNQYSKISTDELTGINNRREFKLYLDNMFENANVDTIFVCMIDVDYFKTINDSYGHLEGDEALKNVTQILKKLCSMYSQRFFLGRYGGDEFIIAGINTEESELVKMKENLKNIVDDYNNNSGKEYKITLSLGYSTGKVKEYDNREDLIRKADEAMYYIKKERVKK